VPRHIARVYPSAPTVATWVCADAAPDWQAKAIAMAVAARKDLRPLASLRGLVSLRILFSFGPARFDIDCR
jgi:hypothetical protein